MQSTPHTVEVIQGNVLDIDLHGKLSRQDYEKLGPSIDEMIRQHGKIRILVTMHDFDGWDAGGLWEDIKWELKHFNDVERVAIVGEENWHKWMAGFCNAFTTAEVRYFTSGQLFAVQAWLNEYVEPRP